MMKGVVVLVIIIVIAAVLVWYFALREEAPPPVVETPAGAPIEAADLGSRVFEEATNPLSGELPETVAPLANPLEGVYRNPFEE